MTATSRTCASFLIWFFLLPAFAPALAISGGPLSPACAAAYAALASYYAGEITKAEAEAAVAVCEAESQDPPGDGQGGGGSGGGGSGGGGQGQIPQAPNGNGNGQDSSSLPGPPLQSVGTWVRDNPSHESLSHLAPTRCYNTHIIVRIPRDFPGADSNPHWVYRRVTIDNPFYQDDDCVAVRAAFRAAEEEAERQRRIAEWAINEPEPYCDDRTFHPQVTGPNASESSKRTRYYVVHVVPDTATGEWDEKTLVQNSGLALDVNGLVIGSVWSSDVYFDRAAVIREMAKFDCSNTVHNDVVPDDMITTS